MTRPVLDPPVDPAEFAARIRTSVVRMCLARRRGYVGQGLALADLLAHLYGRAMRRGPDGAYRDRFVLSTGHSAIGLFATLGVLGLYEEAELATYGADGSRIEESPLEGLPGFEITAGALGQGLSQALGIALGERMQGRDTTVYCLLSDGELQEGQVWEAAMAAGHHRVGNLVVLVDNNRIQADGDTAAVMAVEPVPEKFAAFGFDALRLDPHDHDALARDLPAGGVPRDRPLALVCQTVPGKGVPSLERSHKVHYLRAEQPVWEQALRELAGEGS
jgi:transketolase